MRDEGSVTYTAAMESAATRDTDKAPSAFTQRVLRKAARRHEELDSGRLPDLLPAIRRHADRCEEARKCFQYIHHNRERMSCPAFKAQGLCTSTGVVEAGGKVAIGVRLKRAGMQWTTAGANTIIALRCCRLSGRFQDFWERRTERQKAAWPRSRHFSVVHPSALLP